MVVVQWCVNPRITRKWEGRQYTNHGEETMGMRPVDRLEKMWLRDAVVECGGRGFQLENSKIRKLEYT